MRCCGFLAILGMTTTGFGIARLIVSPLGFLFRIQSRHRHTVGGSIAASETVFNLGRPLPKYDRYSFERPAKASKADLFIRFFESRHPHDQSVAHTQKPFSKEIPVAFWVYADNYTEYSLSQNFLQCKGFTNITPLSISVMLIKIVQCWQVFDIFLLYSAFLPSRPSFVRCRSGIYICSPADKNTFKL